MPKAVAGERSEKSDAGQVFHRPASDGSPKSLGFDGGPLLNAQASRFSSGGMIFKIIWIL